MRHLSTFLLTITMFAVPLSAQAEDAKGTKEAKTAPAAKHNKRKTAAKPQKGAISVDKLKQEVTSRIAHEREQAEQVAGKGTGARKVLDGAVARVKAKLASVTGDGLVTKEELKGVRDSYKLMAMKQNSPAKAPAKGKSKKLAPRRASRGARPPRRVGVRSAACPSRTFWAASSR